MPEIKNNNNLFAALLIISAVFSVASLVYYFNVKTPLLERILNRGELIALSRNAPTTYYETNDGYAGIEYDLLELFARHLGVKLKIIVPEHFSDILPMIEQEQADIAAAGISITWPRKEKLFFSPPYQEIKPELIYNKKQWKKINTISDVIGKKLAIVKGSSHVDILKSLAVDYPELKWTEDSIHSSEELMLMVQDKKLDFTIADSNEFSLVQRFSTDLKAAFAVSKPQKLAWALKKQQDLSLLNEVKAFFQQIQQQGILTQLLEKYYGHITYFNTTDAQEFMRQIRKKLKKYLPLFMEIAKKYQFDWKLLAAIAYQESHWNPRATSPTGVRGMMMLTRKTAGQLNIKNRLDARQSMDGGARYLKKIEKKFHKRIKNPDRLWFTLASYNIGYGHLEDARILAQKQGKDPDKWSDVKEYLKLLSKKRWYKKTRRGYARGRQAVHYVQNIRRLYDLLDWYEKKQLNPEKKKPAVNNEAIKILPKSL